jgi:hypothetical protein
MNNAIPFAAVADLLKGLGFVETTLPQSHLCFEHASSQTILVYRPYRPADVVTPGDLAKTRRFLDEKGLLPAETFESRLAAAVTPAAHCEPERLKAP